MPSSISDTKVRISEKEDPDLFRLCNQYGTKYMNAVLKGAIVSFTKGVPYQRPDLTPKQESHQKNLILRACFSGKTALNKTLSEYFHSYQSTAELCKILLRIYSSYEAAAQYCDISAWDDFFVHLFQQQTIEKNAENLAENYRTKSENQTKELRQHSETHSAFSSKQKLKEKEKGKIAPTEQQIHDVTNLTSKNKYDNVAANDRDIFSSPSSSSFSSQNKENLKEEKREERIEGKPSQSHTISVVENKQASSTIPHPSFTQKAEDTTKTNDFVTQQDEKERKENLRNTKTVSVQPTQPEAKEITKETPKTKFDFDSLDSLKSSSDLSEGKIEEKSDREKGMDLYRLFHPQG